MAKNPVRQPYSEEIARFLEGTANFSDIVFGFMEESSESTVGNLCDCEEDDNEDVEENKAFWEAQEKLLQATIGRTSSFESKLRQAVKYSLEEIKLAGSKCSCRTPVAGGCRTCMRKEISVRLQNVGYNCVICKSKWKSSSEIPAGNHTYLEVVEKSKKGDVIRVVIELNFRAEFEMARANEEYNRLVNRLPEVFVGKTERLKAVIKIMCAAAKKCMKEKKMHIAPWRKHKYMQAKWLGGYHRSTAETTPLIMMPVVSYAYADRQPKPKAAASMLTFDLMENFGGLHCGATAAVEVL